MEKLLNKVEIINYKYEKLNRKTKFNIFSILRRSPMKFIYILDLFMNFYAMQMIYAI